MMFCPHDLAPCCRSTCLTGVCERLDDAVLFACWECGEVFDRHGSTVVCAACARVHCAAVGTER